MADPRSTAWEDPSSRYKMCYCAALGNLQGVKSFTEHLPSSEWKQLTPDYWRAKASKLSSVCEASPLVIAAQEGNSNVVDFLLNRFCEPAFLDHTAAISFSWGSQLHHCTALNAASISGRVDVARVLLDAGASHGIVDCTGSTPFCEATFHGHFAVMRCLHERGADVNAPNDFGWSPLHVAASAETKGCELLVEMGAESGRKTPEGYSALHVAAAKGKLRTVKLLLEKGFPPAFGTADPSNPDYVPCPLYLAAVTGYSSIVSLFIHLKEGSCRLCPPTCEYNALLLLAAKLFESSELKLKHWKKAFDVRLRPDSEISPLYLPPRIAYGSRTELVSTQELDELVEKCRVGGDLAVELHYQALIIRERCIGERDPQLFHTLTQLSKRLVKTGSHREAELLLFRAMELTERYRVAELENGYVLPQTIEADVGKWVEHSLVPALLAMSADRTFVSSFGRYITFGLKLLRAIQDRDQILQVKYGCNRGIPKYFLENILLVFKVWLYCNTQAKSGQRSREECDELGRKFVTNWLHLKNGSTLLHVAISAPRELEGLSSHINTYLGDTTTGLDRSLAEFYSEWTLDSLLVTSLLKWGAADAINLRDSQNKGNLPLHLAATRTDRVLLNVLLSHGAHRDAVNADGKLPWHMCQQSEAVRTEVKEILCGSASVPPSLGCQAALTVIREGLPYEQLSIAPRLKSFIALHDEKAQLV